MIEPLLFSFLHIVSVKEKLHCATHTLAYVGKLWLQIGSVSRKLINDRDHDLGNRRKSENSERAQVRLPKDLSEV